MNFIEKRSNYTRWLIESVANDDFSNNKEKKIKKEEQLENKIKELEEELNQTNLQVQFNNVRLDTEEGENLDYTDILEKMKEEEKFFDGEVKQFKDQMANSIFELSQVLEESKRQKRMKNLKYNVYKDEFKLVLRELDQITECPIIFSKYSNPYLAPSGHIFDEFTIYQMKKHNGSDPLTRIQFADNTNRPHYLCKDVLDVLNRFASVTDVKQ
mmetsp:Transcript_6777/g.5925  ORF Transcript_6777/g.5925 Transcript_6777/m.5925 type:complete len:213 (+) Transcript_6777:204-842(+)